MKQRAPGKGVARTEIMSFVPNAPDRVIPTMPPWRRAALLAGLHIIATTLIILTGGPSSPLYSLLFLCLFLSALYFGVWGAAVSSLAHISLLFLLVQRLLNLHLRVFPLDYVSLNLPSTLQFLDRHPALAPGLFVLCQFAVATTTGLIARQFAQTASRALATVAAERVRMERVQWLIDTTLMMQSMLDLRDVLSVVLLRLGDKIPLDSIAIYLCDSDAATLTLAQTMNLPHERVGTHRLPLTALSALNDSFYSPQSLAGEFNAHLWNNLPQLNRAGTVWASVDEHAQSVVVAPLATMEETLGAIYIGAHRPNAFDEEDRRLLADFAQQVFSPVQRVRLEAMATTDALTGLYNRRVFWRNLKEEVDRSKRYGPPLSLLLIDIDHFKQVNDTHGHRSGDTILAQLAALLQRSIRTTDSAARYGGEEMVIICPETTAEEAVRFAERLRRSVETYPFLLPDGKQIRMTISVGVAALGDAIRDDTVLVETADAGLYEAKAAGRNLVRSGEMNPMAHREREK